MLTKHKEIEFLEVDEITIKKDVLWPRQTRTTTKLKPNGPQLSFITEQ